METFASYIKWMEEDRFILFFNGDVAWIVDLTENTVDKGTYFAAPGYETILSADGRPILYLENS